MALFRITRRTPLTAAEAWRRVTDWERHAAPVPLTAITVTTAPPTGPGTRFTARTSVGPVGFDDPMEVTRWQPPRDGGPGLCRLDKRGSVVTGWAEIEVRPGVNGSIVQWREDLRVAALPSAFDGATAWSGRLLFGRVLGRLLAG
ncbi:SRPBCC family protein [Streptomyces sp. PTM05]|uniref:SRPBCC family protein n=1 Tax=Streptantibioticus parmotrematis TaxID=2873249 RepID=A0ABS7QYG9_9ACTN|nr:SRPBCC family protein [Streptantibioticus parmotrematis]MBY8888265.1 SRPBCC family protein [Streptantibioticus parmotrematis]